MDPDDRADDLRRQLIEAGAEIASLRESEAKYRGVFESMTEVFGIGELIRDAAGRVVDCRFLEFNPVFEAHFGRRREEVIGRSFRETFVTADLAYWLDLFARAVETRSVEAYETYVTRIDRWLAGTVTPIGGGRFYVVHRDITARRKAETALCASDERQAFLLGLGDALRRSSDPIEVQKVAVNRLGEALQVDRCCYTETDWVRRVVLVTHEYRAGGIHSVAGEHPLAPFETLQEMGAAGDPVACDDIAAHPVLGAEADAYRDRDVAAFVVAPLVKDGRTVAFMCLTMRQPRRWTDSEIRLLRAVAGRTWAAVERARAETALHESEARFTQFAGASGSGLWVRDAATLQLEYASPAIATIYGIEPDAIRGEVERWAGMIVPEDRGHALACVARTARGEAVVHEFRIQRRSDLAFRWIRNTDFPLHGDIHGARPGHIQRIGGIAEDITDEKLHAEHQAVLLAELQHRVRNIMTIILSIVARTAESVDSVEGQARRLSERLMALARVQALLTRSARARVGITAIVHEELAAQALHVGQIEVGGPDVLLAPKAAEMMTLAIHELATNALKYGALSARDGLVTVGWRIIEARGVPWLCFDWVETGAPPLDPPPSGRRRTGFGAELIEGRVPYELGGHGKVEIEAGGARCRIEFPLKEGASLLESDAPLLATVFGGAIDMTGQADLTGQRVLVLEDDYYLATDTARALKGAGAQVIGPCLSEEAARVALADTRSTCAVLDINLQAGRTFALARELKAAGVPLLFVTGYDVDVIPADLAEVRRLQKPAPFHDIINALAETLGLAG